MRFFRTSRNRRLLLDTGNWAGQFFRTSRNWFKRLLRIPRITQHQITYERVRRHLVATNKSARKRFVSNLKNAGKKEGWLAKLKHFLFIHPNTIYLAQLAIFVILFYPLDIILSSVKEDSLLRQVFAFFA